MPYKELIMKFYTNKISTGKAPNFSDFVQKLASANSVIKTASEHVNGEEECLDGKQKNLPTDLKKKIVEKKEEDGACEVDKVEKEAAAKDNGKKIDEKEKSDGKKECLAKEECYASTHNMVRIANLDAKTKSEWKAYWKKLYPSEYVEAMFADK